MGLVPFPCGGDDIFYVGVLNLPAEFLLSLGGVGIEGGWIASAAFGFDYGNRKSGDLLNCGDDFADGVGCAGAEVVEVGRAGFVEFFKDRNVGARKVVYMYIVPEAGAIGGRIVRAEDLDVFTPPGGGVNDERDEVGLGVMVLANSTVLGCPGSVEIAEGRKAKTIGVGEGFQAVLDVELGLAVWVDRGLRERLHHGEGLGFAVGCAGGGEDEFLYAVVEHGLEKTEGGNKVVFVILAGLGDGFTHVGESCEVHDEFNLLVAKDLADRFGIAEVAVVKGNGLMNRRSVPKDEIVEHNGLMPRGLQLTHAMTADVTGSSNDEYLHINLIIC